MITALDTSKAILSLYPPDYGEILSNLKLQKLLYYAQGFNLAVFNEPLFDDKIFAWQYGPVVKKVYNEYKSFGSGGIMLDESTDIKKILPDKSRRSLLKEVNEVYGQFSAIKLMNMTHSEPPWKTTKMDEEISHDKLKAYFKTRLKGGK